MMNKFQKSCFTNCFYFSSIALLQDCRCERNPIFKTLRKSKLEASRNGFPDEPLYSYERGWKREKCSSHFQQPPCQE